MNREMKSQSGTESASGKEKPREMTGSTLTGTTPGMGMERKTSVFDMTGMSPADMGRSGEARGMPAPGSGGAAREMPTKGMTEGEGGPGMPRFRPPGGPTDTLLPPVWEPGVVEVQFREGAGPQVFAVAAAGPEVRSSAGTGFDEFNQILRTYEIERAEPTFQTTLEGAMAAQAVARQKGMDVPSMLDFVTLHFPPGADVQKIAEELSRLPDVERAVAVPVAIPPQTPLNEPLVGTSDVVVTDPVTGLDNQWYVQRTGVDHAWAMASGENVVIADVDWGFRTTHQDLASRLDLTHAYNAYDGGTNVSRGTDTYHGTAVMGLAGGADNDLGMAGIAFAATLWPIQANTAGPGPSLGGNPWARGIEWVRTADSGARRKVIILEVQTGAFGNYEQVPSVNTAIRTAIAHGVVVCVAAGNGDRDAGLDDSNNHNPIPATGSILVGATAYHATNNQRAGFSNYGSRVVVSAPGDAFHDVTCGVSSDNDYRNRFGGTSGATPKVAATAALMLSVNPSLTHDEIRTILNTTGTAVTPDPDPRKTIGTFLNSEAAVREARRCAAGRLEVFVRGWDHSLGHIWQVALNDGWSGWGSLGGWVDSPVVKRNADGRLEVFVIGVDHGVKHNWQLTPNGNWSNWASLGGVVDLLAAAQNADGRLEVFARGMDGALLHIWQLSPGGAWSEWASMGGFIDMLAVGQNADGRLEVFVRGMDGALWHNWQLVPNGTWGGWMSLSGVIDRLAVGQNADGRLEVFARGMDRALWHTWQTAPGGAWSEWTSRGGWIDAPVVVRNADGRLEVFVIGSDHGLWHQWQVTPNGGWANWSSLGGWIDMLAASQNADGRLEVFARGMDGALWHIWQLTPGGAWSNWDSFGGVIDALIVGQNARA